MFSAPSRRGLFGLLAGAAALPLAKRQFVSFNWNGYDEALPPATGMSAELMAITRKAFIPKFYTQIYTKNPLLSLIGTTEEST